MKTRSSEITIFYKGILEIHKIRSGLLSLIIAGSVFHALSPFINIYMSGQILNGIAEKQPFKHLLLLVLLTVSINLIIGIIASIFKMCIRDSLYGRPRACIQGSALRQKNRTA